MESRRSARRSDGLDQFHNLKSVSLTKMIDMKESEDARRQSLLWKRLVLTMCSLLGVFSLILLIAGVATSTAQENRGAQHSPGLRNHLSARSVDSRVPFSSSPLDHLVQWETVLFEPLNETEAKDAWKCLPNGNGLTYLDDEIKEEYNLPRGLPDGSGGHSLYGISWTHQLYCLSILRTALSDALEGAVSEDSTETAHFFDCFEYLRTKISCNPDLTIEYPTGDEDIIDGWDMHHQCAQRMPIGFWIMDHHPEKLQNFRGYGTTLKIPKWAQDQNDE